MEIWIKKSNPAIQVEAVRLNEDNAADVAAWCGGDLVEEIDPEHPQEKQPGINVPTSGGRKRASLGNYVIKYGKNFFVESVRGFEIKYEPESRQTPPPESAGDTRKKLGFSDPFGGRM